MSEHLVDIQNLSRRFGRQTALHDISLQMPKGTVLGLVGENGAGKTTLIKHILGLYRAQQGTVRVAGRDPVAEPVSVLAQIGYLSEDRELPEWMRVDEFLHYSRAFYPDWDDEFAEHLRVTFELETRQRIAKLSRGQRARVGLIAALAHRPALLVLDEPSSGLDPIVRRDILAAIIRTVADEGRSVLFSSHLLDEVERVADSVAMLHQGRLQLQGDLAAILQRHQRLTLNFPHPLSAAPPLPAGMDWRGEGRTWSCVCNGQQPELEQAAADLGAIIADRHGVGLEEVFLAHTSSEQE